MRLRTLGLLLSVGLLACRAGSPGEGPRPPAVAGQFYPAEGPRLEAAVRGFLADAVPCRHRRPLALVLPHAGYAFSGQIAADGWVQARELDPEVVVLLAPNHTVAPFRGVSVSRAAGYRTPLGTAPVDLALGRDLARACPEVVWRPEAHAREHAEEVQVPFIQVLFPHARILPCVLGSPDPDTARRFGRELAAVLRGRRALVVASSDLSHYPAQARAEAADRATLAAVASLDPDAFLTAVRRAEREGGLDTAACGQGPILAALEAAKALGAASGTVLSYANSGGTVLGDPDRVVGYGAVMATADPPEPGVRGPGPPADASGRTLDDAERHKLLALARHTLEAHFRTGLPPLPRPASPELRRFGGAFVTWRRKGELRGCIGRLQEQAPLALTVARMALHAALADPRFPPVAAGELPGLTVEVSVLSPLREVAGPEEILAGRDGVVMEKDGRSAVFLPQVAVEQGWDRDELLGQLSLKAGLPKDAWRRGARFRTFRAEVFAEAVGR